jgi:hypothetical protein
MDKRIARLVEKIEKTQNNCSFDDIARLLCALGYEVRAAGSSHHVFRKPGREPLSVPRAKPVKRTYVKAVMTAIQADLQEQTDDRKDHTDKPTDSADQETPVHKGTHKRK